MSLGGTAANSAIPWKPLLICPHNDLLQKLSALWHAARGEPVVSREYLAIPALRDLVARQSPNICFLDVGTNSKTALVLLTQVRELGIPVVALHTHNEPELILNCLRSGSAEFLCLPFGLDQL